jgi:hypothetical protein
MARAIINPLRISTAERRNLAIGLLFAAPWIIGFLGFTVYPLASSLYYSFTRFDLIGEPVWIGLRNYLILFTSDEDFRIVMYNTFWWVLISSPMGIISAFLMALLLNTEVIARPLYRAIFFFPSIVPVVVFGGCAIRGNQRHATLVWLPDCTLFCRPQADQIFPDCDPHVVARRGHGHLSSHFAGCTTHAL